MKLERLHRLTLLCALATLASCQQAPAPKAALTGETPRPNIRINTTDNGTFIDVYGNGEEFDAAQLVNLTVNSVGVRRIGLYGLVLPDKLPGVWANLSSLRTLAIDCAARPSPDTRSQSGGSSSAGGVVGRFGSKAQLESVQDLIRARMNGNGPNIRNVSIVNCGIEGNYGQVWRDYLSEVKSVNLSGNALTGDFTSIDFFDRPCNDTFAGDDYGDPDCSASWRQSLDVSRNRLSGHISTGAALGDDVTDALCSTACISLVMAPGIDDEEVLCRAPLVIYTLDNPGLVYRSGVRFASGYVTRDSGNWCFMPASRWVLPTMWSVFLALMAATLAITLYARVRLKRVPFRMKSAAFDVLGRGSAGSTDSLNGRLPGGLSGAFSGGGGSGGYVGLAGGVGVVEMAERQAMIPKNSCDVEDGGSNSGDVTPLAAYVSATAVSPSALPVSSVPAAAAAPEISGTSSGGGAANGSSSPAAANGAGRPGIRLGRGKRDPIGIRVALTSGLEDSSCAAAAAGGSAGGVKPGSDAIGEVNMELYGTSNLDPGSGLRVGGGSGGITLQARASAASLRASGSAGGAAVPAAPDGERTWRTVLRSFLSRALEILGMQLRTLLILGMFGLECYWAYGLIRYRGGWQLLVLIPNYLEHTLAGIAMLRAFMAGTHGRWKYVAPVPLLPFTMASVYLVYGFITYPFGWADMGPVSWEKFIDLMDSCGVLSSTCWAIFSSLAYWQGNSVLTSYQYFNTDIFVGMLLMCFTDLLSTAHHLASTLQVPFKQWLRRELDVRKVVPLVAPDKSHRLQGDGDL